MADAFLKVPRRLHMNTRITRAFLASFNRAGLRNQHDAQSAGLQCPMCDLAPRNKLSVPFGFMTKPIQRRR
jgi:hypothetical protein